MEEEKLTFRIPGWLALVAAAAIAVGVRFWYRGLGVPDIPLCVVNTSSDAPLDIRLDGKSIGAATKMAGEDPKAAVLAVLGVGPHAVEARNASGVAVAQESFTVAEDSHGYLWTPLPSADFCFLLQTSVYGAGTNATPLLRLEGPGPLRPLPAMVTRWFRDNPKAVSVRKGTKYDFERALRRANCR